MTCSHNDRDKPVRVQFITKLELFRETGARVAVVDNKAKRTRDTTTR